MMVTLEATPNHFRPPLDEEGFNIEVISVENA